MEALIQQDFEFDQYSLIYGQFLQEVHETYADVVIHKVNGIYPWVNARTVVVQVDVPESLAVVLKLRFGKHLRQRPAPPTEEEIKLKKEESKISLKSRYYAPWFKKNIVYTDYVDILKTITIEEECELKDFYRKTMELYKDTCSIKNDLDKK